MSITIDDIEDQTIEAFQSLLEELVDSSVAVETAFLSTRDGILLAGTGDDEELDLMAAISASLLSLADALSSRSEKGLSKKVVSESKDNALVVLHAGGVILTVIGEPKMNMGFVLTESKKLAKKVSQLVSTES